MIRKVNTKMALSDLSILLSEEDKRKLNEENQKFEQKVVTEQEFLERLSFIVDWDYAIKNNLLSGSGVMILGIYLRLVYGIWVLPKTYIAKELNSSTSYKHFRKHYDFNTNNLETPEIAADAVNFLDQFGFQNSVQYHLEQVLSLLEEGKRKRLGNFRDAYLRIIETFPSSEK